MEGQTFQNRDLIEPRGTRDDRKNEKQHTPNKKEGGPPQHRPILEEKLANMVPSWLPNSIKNRLKIDAKIDQKFDASWD